MNNMEIKRLLNHNLLAGIVERVHEDNLPVEICVGENKNGLVDVLFVYPDTFQDEFEPLMDGVFNEVFGPLEGGFEL
ncbi:hypothetical protein DXB58_26890 [Bacteroides sp. OM05-10AA]|jgi:hypothetical protein|nr:hypothetical protein DXB58_26890 [Bacteroides sp. OM05-10AA]RGQ56519.1 hypothetical protein DWY87_26925 [Bacteroides sp. AF27-33]